MNIKSKIILSFLMIKSLFAAPIPAISPKESMELFTQKKAIIVDVRETDELKNGMVKDAMIMPLSLLNTDAFEEIVKSLPSDKDLIIYCRSGRRSNVMGIELEKRGYQVWNMGAFSAWRDAGLPVVIP